MLCDRDNYNNMCHTAQKDINLKLFNRKNEIDYDLKSEEHDDFLLSLNVVFDVEFTTFIATIVKDMFQNDFRSLWVREKVDNFILFDYTTPYPFANYLSWRSILLLY